MGKKCNNCMDGAPDYYCCLLVCGELEVCRYCDWSGRRVVTRCPMEEKEKMDKILEMGNGKPKRYMTFKDHIEKMRALHEKNIHEKYHRCSKGIQMNADKFIKNTPKSVTPELVDITDTDFEWIEELDDDTRIKIYRKLCDLGVPYLV